MQQNNITSYATLFNNNIAITKKTNHQYIERETFYKELKRLNLRKKEADIVKLTEVLKKDWNKKYLKI